MLLGFFDISADLTLIEMLEMLEMPDRPLLLLLRPQLHRPLQHGDLRRGLRQDLLRVWSGHCCASGKEGSRRKQDSGNNFRVLCRCAGAVERETEADL